MSMQQTDPTAEQPPTGVVIPADPPPPPQPKTYTEQELEAERKKIREEMQMQLSERDKAFNAMQDEINKLREAQNAEEQRRSEEQRRLAEEEAARRAAEEENLSAKELLDRRTAEIQAQLNERENEWQQRYSALQSEIATRDALLDKEREWQALQDYKSQRLTEYAEQIHPALRDLVAGSTPEEIDQSLAGLIEKSNRIVEDVEAVQGQQRQQQRGVSLTGAPPIGPMDIEPGTQSFTEQDLKNMSMAEYEKYRPRLLSSALANRNRGLFD